MKTYFERLSKIGKDAVIELRKLDLQHAEMHKSYLEDKQKGNLTEQGYRGLVSTLDTERDNFVAKYKEKIGELATEFATATDEYTTPSAGRMKMEDVELLKNFELSTKEFEGLASKYADNPTMGRLLEKYRVEHSIDTNWRYQTGEQRKAIFRSAANSIECIINQSDKYSPDREGAIDLCTSNSYHKLQGSNPNDMIAPEGVDNSPKPTFF